MYQLQGETIWGSPGGRKRCFPLSCKRNESVKSKTIVDILSNFTRMLFPECQTRTHGSPKKRNWKLVMCKYSAESSATAFKLASYADALWARHAIFLPHERLLKPRGHSFPFVYCVPVWTQRSAGDHVKTTLEPIGIG